MSRVHKNGLYGRGLNGTKDSIVYSVGTLRTHAIEQSRFSTAQKLSRFLKLEFFFVLQLHT